LPNNPPDFGRDFAVLRKRRIRTGRSSLWGFLDRHDITLEKRCRPLNGSALTSPARAEVGFESKGCLTPPGWYFSTRPQSAPTWDGTHL
jgi:hypothetical protein